MQGKSPERCGQDEEDMQGEGSEKNRHCVSQEGDTGTEQKLRPEDGHWAIKRTNIGIRLMINILLSFF